MNIDELKASWQATNEQGIPGHSEVEIEKIISQGTSDLVKNINRKLFKEVTITAVAALVSALAVVLFYAIYDPTKHSQVDPAKVLPVQLLAFVIFSVLFLFGWMEYKLVNRQFSADSVRSFITSILTGLRKNYSYFITLVLLLLAGTFYLELDLLLGDSGIWPLKAGGAAMLTALSFLGIRSYYQKSFGGYLSDLRSYARELEGNS